MAVAHLEAGARAVVEALAVQWSWDDRFSMVLTTYKKADEDAIMAGLNATFSASWTSDQLGAAPPATRELAGAAGGLNPGQRLLHTETDRTFMFATAWPWGDGQTVSLRIGIADAEDDQAALDSLRSWFGAG